MMKTIAEVISKSKSAAIFPHENADGDCLGSAFALKLILEQAGKNACVILEEPHPRTLGILYGAEESPPFPPDIAIAVDCGDLERLGSRAARFTAYAETVNIDHHPTNSNFARYNYVDPTAAATGELIYALAGYAGVPLTREIAHNLYAALSSDTGGFKYSNTTAKTHRLAAELIDYGIAHDKINEFLFDKNPFSKIQLMRDALNSFETYADGKLAVVSITAAQTLAAGASEEDAGGLIVLPRSLETAVASLCFRESSAFGAIRVSMRSNVIDVSEIARKFGGGGHVRASGCLLRMDLQSAKDAVVREVCRVLP
ncbi:MAG: bifunctional oligoribonuclease/PAP phosphatase NrnA [Clostridiales bacterium]|jgi:phosphoesterase RecJ-like protein|nr:bifunctional oligoribonuclease/PAP phosphatase NrnA [Clostridiales bacterium]